MTGLSNYRHLPFPKQLWQWNYKGSITRYKPLISTKKEKKKKHKHEHATKDLWVDEGFGTGYEFYILRFLSFLSLIYLQQVMGWKSLTFLVLSIAFNIETFKSSKAARTFSYSPRCWEKYAKNNTKYDIMKISQKDLYYSLVIMLVICCFQISYRTALLCPHCWRKKKRSFNYFNCPQIHKHHDMK